jgi:hypothetical protein
LLVEAGVGHALARMHLQLGLGRAEFAAQRHRVRAKVLELLGEPGHFGGGKRRGLLGAFPAFGLHRDQDRGSFGLLETGAR